VKNQGKWRFAQPRNCAVISLRDIVFKGKPILYVTHDADDEGWQFLTGDSVSKEEAVVVCFEEIVERDASILKLADLPPGWIATRKSANSGWERRKRQ
jgi:hypothetical protein